MSPSLWGNYAFAPGRSRIIPVPDRLDPVSLDRLEILCMALPPGATVSTASQVETNGYKNIVKLPDWLAAHNIRVKSKKPYQNGRIYLPDTCPFFSSHKVGTYAIVVENGAIHAGATTFPAALKSSGVRNSGSSTRQRWSGSKCRSASCMPENGSLRRQKVQQSKPEYRPDGLINHRLVYTKGPRFRKDSPPLDRANTPIP